MAENYIAFISYRHKPLDSLVAARLHRMIEHYRIQRELRHDGMKYPGRVFRDRDELPLSSDLTNELRGALDNSEFLIVVCTPDTPESIWVDREIEYFLRSHDRDNVLAVLAAGTQEQSFPKRLTEIYGSDGVTVIDQIEPLAANVSDDTTPTRWMDRFLSQGQRVTGRLRLEFLRLMAAILHCPYDALRQRHKQYRQQQIMAAFGVVALVALAFVFMLLDRNSQILEQMELARANEQRAQAGEQLALENERQAQENARQAQSNESYALALLSEQQLANGNRTAALQSALTALPIGEDDRPYRVEAEKALADALYVYQAEALRQTSRMEQITDIEDMVLSADGTHLITRDVNNMLRCFDTASGELLWEQDKTPYGRRIVEVIDEKDAVIVVGYNGIKWFNLDNGDTLAEYELHNDYYDMNQNTIKELILSPDRTEIVELLTPNQKERDGEVLLVFFDVSSGQERMTVSLGTFWREEDDYINGELQLSDDGKKWLVQLYTDDFDGEEPSAQASVIIGDTKDGTILNQLSWELPGLSHVNSAIVENKLVIVRHLRNSIWVEGYRIDDWEQWYCNEITVSEEWRSGLDERLCVGGNWNFWWCYGRALYTLNRTDGDVETHQILSEEVLATEMVKGNTTGELYLVLKDGLIVCSNNPHADSIDQLPIMGEFSFDLTKALIDQNNSLFCGIPEDEPGTVVCIRQVQDTQFKKFDTFSTSKPDHVYRLPNGHVIETFSNYPKDYVAVYSLYRLSIWQMHDFSIDSNSMIETFGNNGNTLLFGGLRPTVLDIEEARTWSISALLPQEYQNSSMTWWASAPIADNGNGLIVWDDYKNNQVFVWDDMRSTHSISYDGQGSSISDIIAAGNNGWIVMGVRDDDQGHFIACNAADESWNSISNSNVNPKKANFCVADSQPWIAATGDDSFCRIFDLTTGDMVWEKYLPATAEMVEEIRFSQEDSLLLVRLQHEILYLISLDKEDEWHTFVLQDWNDGSFESQLIIQADKTGNALYVADSGGWMTGLCLDRETLQVKAEIPGLFCYVPETEQVLCRRDGIYAYPAYSLEDLITQAQEILGTP